MGHAFCKLLREKKDPKLFIERITVVGVGTWTVPSRVRSIDVFLVGGGGLGGGTNGSARNRGGSGGNGGQCVTSLGFVVAPFQQISLFVGGSGEDTFFGTLTAAAGAAGTEGTDYSGTSVAPPAHVGSGMGGNGGRIGTSDGAVGEGDICRDFGEASGIQNAGGGGGGGGAKEPQRIGGITGRTEGSGLEGLKIYEYGGGGGGGYGGGGGGSDSAEYSMGIIGRGGAGGSGVIMIRYWAYHE